MWLILKPFLPYLAIGGVFLYGYLWHLDKVGDAYDLGWKDGRAQLMSHWYMEEERKNQIIDEKAQELETVKIVTKTKLVPVEKEIIKYVETPRVDQCPAEQYVNPSKPFDPVYVSLLDSLAAGEYTGSSEAASKPISKVSGETPSLP